MGDLEPQETLPFKVSRRGNADLSGAPLQVQVDGEVTEKAESVNGERQS